MEAKEFAARYGPWALVAGASEGTGAEFARQLAGAGLNLMLVARREAPLEALADALRDAHGIACVTASIDLAREDAADALMTLAAERETGLLVLNAGADPNGALFLDRPLDNWNLLAARNVMTTMQALYLSLIHI